MIHRQGLWYGITARGGVLSRQSSGNVARWTFGTNEATGGGKGFSGKRAPVGPSGVVVEGMWEYLNATDKRVGAYFFF